MDRTIYVAKTKALISFAVTAKLICVFVFAYAICWFSHGAAHIEDLTLAVLSNDFFVHMLDFSSLSKNRIACFKIPNSNTL